MYEINQLPPAHFQLRWHFPCAEITRINVNIWVPLLVIKPRLVSVVLARTLLPWVSCNIDGPDNRKLSTASAIEYSTQII